MTYRILLPLLALAALVAPQTSLAAINVWNGQPIYTDFNVSLDGGSAYYAASPTLTERPFNNTCAWAGGYYSCGTGLASHLPLKVAINQDGNSYNAYPTDTFVWSSDPTWNYGPSDAPGSYGGYFWQVVHGDSLSANRICNLIDTTSTATSWYPSTFSSPSNNSGIEWNGSVWRAWASPSSSMNGHNAILNGLVCTTSALPANTLTASDTTIEVGESVTLSWDAGANADAQSTVCTATNFTPTTHQAHRFFFQHITTGLSYEGYYDPGMLVLNGVDQGYAIPDRSGSVTVTPASGQTQYCYSCTNGNGTTNQCVTVQAGPTTPPATASLTPASQTITSGQSATLNWSSTNATTCTATGFTAGATSGSTSVSPTSTTTYSLSCTGPGGTSAVQYATVTVTNPPLTATCSPSTSGIGVNQSMNWFGSASGGTGTGYTYTWGGTAPLAGMSGASPSVTYTSTGTKTGSVTVRDSSGATATASCSGSVTVYPALSTTCSVSPSSANTGDTITWSASPSGGTGSYTYSWSGTDSLSGTGSSVAKVYSSAGTKSASVQVTSGSQSVSYSCPVTATITALQANLTASAVTPTTATAGSAATFSATLTNNGTASTGSSYTNLFQFDTDADHGTVTSSQTVTAGPTGGGSATSVVSSSYTPAAAGTLYVRVCADNNASFVGTITESNEADNCGVWTAVTVAAAAQPDLTASVIGQSSATQNVAVTLTATVTNGGSATAGGTFPNSFQISGVANVAASNITALAASGSSGISASYTFTSTGSFQVRACADLNTSSIGSVSESNEGNNCSAWQTVTVTAAAQPNITAGSISSSPTNPIVGSAATLSGTISNTGGASTGAGFTNVFQRATSAAGAGATVIGTHSASAVAAGGNTTATLSYTFPSAGTWYVRVCGDNNASFVGTISESNEGDNCGNWTAVTVYDTLTTTCSASPTSTLTGTNVTWTAVAGGGTGTYTYSWSSTGGSPATGSSNPYTTQYSTAGTKTATVTVTSGTQTRTNVACSNTVSVSLAQPDLTAGTPSAPTNATAGVAVNVVALISNGGTASTGSSFTNKVQKADDASGTGATDVATGAMGAIAAGGNQTATISYTFPSADGGTTKYVRICADSASVITESNESNNCGAWRAVTVAPPNLPNLTAGNVSPTTASTGVAVTLQSTISNSGTTSTGSGFANAFQRATDAGGTGATVIGTHTIGAVAAGGTGTASLSYTFPSAGTWYVRTCADNNASFVGIVTESNESDNCGNWTAVVVTTAQPNLSAGGVTPTSATAGSAVTFSATISNTGTASSGAGFGTLLQKANDAAGSGASDVRTGSVASALAAGGTTPSTFSYTFPSGDGGTTKYLRVCADKSTASDPGIVTESNESDNCGAWTAVTVSAPAVPTITSCIPSPAAAAPNENVTWTASVTGFSPAPTSYTWNVTGGTPTSGSGSSNSFSSRFATGGNYAPTVTVSNGSQSAGPFTCTPATISGTPSTCSEPVTTTISASPTRVVSGGSVTVSWSATGVAEGTTCTVTGTDVGGSGVSSRTTSVSTSACNVESGSSNSVNISNITGQRTYTIECSGGVTDSVVVNVLPNYVEF